MASKRDLTIKKRRLPHTPAPLEAETAPLETMEEEGAPAGRTIVSQKRKWRPKNKKERRRRRGRSVIWAVLIRLSVITAILILGVLMWQNRDRLAPAAVVEWFDRVFTGGSKGDGYPVDMSGDRVVSLQPFGNQTVVLTDTALQIYNSTAAQTAAPDEIPT